MPPLYPLFLNVEQKNCLIVGGGNVAYRKANTLLECGAQIEVISPQAVAPLRELAAEKKIRLTLRAFEDGDEKNRCLVFAATGDSNLNRHIFSLCRRGNIWLNAVDDPENCDFYVPALLRRGNVAAAVCTSGQSPLLAAHLRDQIEKIFPEEIGTLAQILGEIREKVSTSTLQPDEKKALYTALLQKDFLSALQQGREDEVRENVKQCISSWLD